MNFDHNNHFRHIAEMCADLVDVFSESVTKDALHTLVSMCLDLSGLKHGGAFTVDIMQELEESVAIDTSVTPHLTESFDEIPMIARRAMQTLQTEFAVTSSLSVLQYEYAFPLRVRGHTLGAIILQSGEKNLLSEEVISSIQSIADVTSSVLDQTHQVQQTRTLATQLQSALNSRIVLEQAKGILAERHNIDFASAFSELRHLARRQQKPIHHVASEIISQLNSSVQSQQISARTSVA